MSSLSDLEVLDELDPACHVTAMCANLSIGEVSPMLRSAKAHLRR